MTTTLKRKRNIPFHYAVPECPSTLTTDAAEDFLAASRGRNASPRYLNTLGVHLRQFTRDFPGQLGKVSVSQLDRHLSKIENPKTRLNHRITLCSLFRHAQRKGNLPYGLTAAEKTERPIVRPREPEILAPEDIAALLAVCEDDKTKAFLIIGAFVGCRSSEISRLKWSDIQDDCIILGPGITKTGRRRIAELPENARALLAPLRKNPEDPVSWAESEVHTLYREIKRLCAKVNVRWEPNCLRHTFVSCHLELHRDPPRTSKTGGHSLSTLEREYLKLVPREQAERWFAVGL